jgi:hypothetical protein
MELVLELVFGVRLKELLMPLVLGIKLEMFLKEWDVQVIEQGKVNGWPNRLL